MAAAGREISFIVKTVEASFIAVDRQKIALAKLIELIRIVVVFIYFKLYFVDKPLSSANLGLSAVF